MRILRVSAAAIAAVLISGLIVSTPASAATDTGHKNIKAVEAPGGKIAVSWGATKAVKYYQVKVSSMPDMSQDVKTYKVSKKKTSTTVKPVATAGATTGNYTYVRVYAVKKNGKIGESPYRAVRLTAPVANPVNPGVTVATFNIRTAEADGTGGASWAARKAAVEAQITASGASVVAIQEAGSRIGGIDNCVPSSYVGSDGHNVGFKDCYWQFEQLDDELTTYVLTNRDEYAKGVGALGKESTRILYDPTKVTLTDSGFFAPSKIDANLQFVPWAVFTDIVTGKQFVFISTHLANNAKGQTEKYWSKLRVKQAEKVIAFAKAKSEGRQVIIAGDMNSNMYTLPSNVVDKEFISAGLFDAYATAANENEFFATFNEFKKPKASGSRTDYIFTWSSTPGLTGSFGYKNWTVRSGVFPSDHNMQTATVPF